MKITFENKNGIIDLNGGVWRIKEIEGLGLCEKTVDVLRYPDTDGQEVLSSATYHRDITISGDILRRDKVSSELTRAIKILNNPGFLKIQAGTKKRKIACRVNLFSAGTKDRNAVYQSFVMQLVCDYPYFEDIAENKLSLFAREDLIENSFTLPCVFTRRTSRVTVVNSGDEITRPKILLVCKNEAQDEDFGIEIINYTLNQHFILNYKMASGEEICISFDDRTIKSNLKTDSGDTNLIGYLGEDTFLSEFYLATGVNDLECIFYGKDCEIMAVCEYSNKYAEAVI